MRQVPKELITRYVIIGNGRMAKHMRFYFDSLDISYQTWIRSQQSEEDLADILTDATHVLLLISDDTIDSFIEHCSTLVQNTKFKWIHFSGCLNSKYAFGAHPLMTFSHHLYPAREYQKIPFTIEAGDWSFADLLPGLPNPHYVISKSQKAYYHALCVMANNFSTLLWQHFFTEMQTQFAFKKTDLLPFLQQTFSNIEENPETALTGPISRRDKIALAKDLAALKEDKHFAIFAAFVKAYLPEAEPYVED
jgi:predicted short-subunit dehydrogenase-like oxidoreductase (DUF2520 family)